MSDHLGTRPRRWAEEVLGSPVVDVRPLTGGVTSTMLRLTDQSGAHSVLRLMTNEPWRTHGAALTTREHETQVMLAQTDIPAPTSIALDAEGEHAGEAAHLMSLLPGQVDPGRVCEADLETVAQLLSTIHALHPEERPRTYQSWAYPSKYVVPSWSRDQSVWERAFEVLGQDPPEYDGTFLHRDFAPRNLLWSGPDSTEITGVVDWVETSWGPAWLDVAHFRTMLAVGHGTDVADRFGAMYTRLTGREPQPYFDVMDVVGLLPAPARTPFLTDPDELARLESHLVSLL